MEMTLSEIIGLTAPILFLYAYAMITLGRWSPDSMRYQMLNFLGAIAILISLIDHWNLPVFILEICWGAISVYGIVKALKARKKRLS
jgi:paired small multidrug resistance pump